MVGPVLLIEDSEGAPVPCHDVIGMTTIGIAAAPSLFAATDRAQGALQAALRGVDDDVAGEFSLGFLELWVEPPVIVDNAALECTLFGV